MEANDVMRVTAEEVKARLDRGEKITFIDARSSESWQKADAQIPGSVRVPPNEAADKLKGIPKDRAVLTYCT